MQNLDVTRRCSDGEECFPEQMNILISNRTHQEMQSFWTWNEEAAAEFAALAQSDFDAHSEMAAQVRRAAQGRIRVTDNGSSFKAPVGARVEHAIAPHPTPFLGEIRGSEGDTVKGPRILDSPRQYRLYFGDIHESGHSPFLRLYASLMSTKGGPTNNGKRMASSAVRNAQTADMRQAMWRIKLFNDARPEVCYRTQDTPAKE